MAAKQNKPSLPESTSSLIMRFELCWHQFRRVRGGLDGQIRVLRFLHNHGPSTQMEIQAALGIKSPAMSEHITKLEKRGYITRTPSPHDRRARIVSFTAAGEEMFDRLLAEETGKDLFSSLTGEEQETLRQILIKLSADWRERDSAE